MSEPNQHITIDYYTDILCVWAWIAQPRLDELRQNWGEQITIRHRYLDVFGDAHQKIRNSWGSDTGFRKFAEHVQSSGSDFDHTKISALIWDKVRPRSSLPAHLVLAGVGLVGGEITKGKLAEVFRNSFFCQAQEIGSIPVLFDIAAKQGLDVHAIQATISDGSALAALSADSKDAAHRSIKGSPTWVINDGRQLLYGNIGYRILHANIEELLRQPAREASWC